MDYLGGHSPEKDNRPRTKLNDVAVGVFAFAKHAHESHELAHSFIMTKGSFDINDELLREAQPLRGSKTKRAVVHAAMEFLVRLEKRKKALRYRGRGVRKNELTR
jgi:Arc/MetJ family transcription regulator